MAISQRLIAACCDAVGEFLPDYGFSLLESQETSVDARVTFLGQYVGLIFRYEKREALLRALIGENEGGKVSELPCGEITPTTRIRCFDLGYLTILRKGTDALQTAAGRLPEEQADAACRFLAEEARDILGGDLSAFGDLDRLVKERARAAAFAKWGDGARQYGW
jgi:hypothetical protein